MGRLSPDTFARSTPSRVRERKLQSHQRCDNVGRLAAGQSGRVNEEAPLFRARTGPVVKAACRVAYVSDRRTVAKQVVHTAFGAPKHVGACLASEPDLGGKQGVTPPHHHLTAREAASSQPPRRNRGNGSGGSVRLVGSTRTWKKRWLFERGQPEHTARTGSLELPSALIRPVAFGQPRSPLDATSPEHLVRGGGGQRSLFCS